MLKKWNSVFYSGKIEHRIFINAKSFSQKKNTTNEVWKLGLVCNKKVSK